MSRKTPEAYSAVYKVLTDNIERTDDIKVFLADFELALRKSASKAFPFARVAGCNTHYDRVRTHCLLFFYLISKDF